MFGFPYFLFCFWFHLHTHSAFRHKTNELFFIHEEAKKNLYVLVWHKDENRNEVNIFVAEVRMLRTSMEFVFRACWLIYEWRSCTVAKSNSIFWLDFGTKFHFGFIGFHFFVCIIASFPFQILQWPTFWIIRGFRISISNRIVCCSLRHHRHFITGFSMVDRYECANRRKGHHSPFSQNVNWIGWCYDERQPQRDSLNKVKKNNNPRLSVA